jgi:tetratricopeptide (TPR) repeat protein
MSDNTKIFISYAHKSDESKKFISTFRQTVDAFNHKNGNAVKFDIWTDQDIIAGERWKKEIDDALKMAFAVLVLITPESVESHYVTYEWSFSLGTGKHVIPIVLEELDDKDKLHDKLAEFHYEKLWDRTDTGDAQVEILADLEKKYQIFRRQQKDQEADQMIQLVYSALDHARQQRQNHDTKNALQSLESSLQRIEKFEDNYGASSQLDKIKDDLFYEIGHTYYLQKNIPEAKHHLEEALKINDSHAYSRLDMGIIAREQADEAEEKNRMPEREEYLDEALKHFKEVIQDQPALFDYNQQSVWASIGGIHKRRDELKEAAENYQKATEYRQSSYPYINLANIYFKQGEIEKMIESAYIARYFARAQQRLEPGAKWAHVDELAAQIILNPHLDDEEPLKDEKMQRLVDRALQIAPQRVLIKHLKRFLRELVEVNELHSEDQIDIDVAEDVLQRLKFV